MRESQRAKAKSSLRLRVEDLGEGSSHNWRIINAIWLMLLAAFIFAGMTRASFHGDEAMQIYASTDYATAFIYHRPGDLITRPPYNIDADVHLRILNGSINRYAIGLSWHLAGLTTDDLPPAPGWDWGLDYATDVATGHRPSAKLLHASRVSSTLFLALSSAVMFGIGWWFGGRLPAYLASGLYTLNPVVLLNGRRAMQEGAFLCFGLLAVYVAMNLAQKRAGHTPRIWRWWLALILASGLALGSKHTAGVFVASAFAWIFVAELLRRDWRQLVKTTVLLAVSGFVVISLFIAISPALWDNPFARLRDLARVRRELVDIQVAADPNAPMSLSRRVEYIFTQPFIEPAMHYEVASWGTARPIVDEIDRYMAAPLSGLHFGWLLGLPLMLLSSVGLVSLLARRDASTGILVWLGLTVLTLLANPLPWQRYYLPLIPVATLLASVGTERIMRTAQARLFN